MAIPSYQKFMLPLLEKVGDGKEHKTADVTEQLADYFRLSEEDKAVTLKSGRSKLYRNRIGWAKTHLTKAGLLETVSHGTFKITEEGKKVLSKKPKEITNQFLMQYPAFAEWTKPAKSAEKAKAPDAVPPEEHETPEDTLDRVHADLMGKFEGDLLDRVKACSPPFFEQLVVDLLVKMGYGGSREEAGKVLGGPGDGGIDGVINEDRLGLDIICVQAKRWENSVPPATLHAFAGSLDAVGAKKGVIITTSSFTRKAVEFAEKIEKRIILIDGSRLAKLMVEFDVGVSPVAHYDVYRIDNDFFEEV